MGTALGRITASVHRKSEASHRGVDTGSRSPRIFDNEVWRKPSAVCRRTRSLWRK